MASTRLSSRLLVPFVGVISFACVGCMESTSGDMALMEIQKLRAEARATEARLAAMEGRQMYVAQQVSMLGGVIGEVGREAGARAEAFAKKQDEITRQVEQAERAAAAERERARLAAEAPQSILARAQAMIDAGQIKATVKNGKTRLDLAEGTTPTASGKSTELEDPWAAQRKPAVPPAPPTAGSPQGKPPVPPAPPAAGSPQGKPAGRRMSDDLGF